jgi:ferritin-like protein
VASEGLHEPADELSAETVDKHRGYVSLIEELEAIDWYNQRVEAADDAELSRVLTHSRDEEKEHAMMTLEWLRRHDEQLDVQMHKYLFSNQSLPLPEGPADATASGGADPSAPTAEQRSSGGTLGIGSLRGDRPRWGGIS